MKFFTIPVILLGFPLSVRAAYTTDFSDAVLAAPADPLANFAPQNGWTISDANSDGVSFTYPGVGAKGTSVGLGGYVGIPTFASTTISHAISEPALNGGQGYFTFDFALINSDGTGGFLNDQDQFGVSLSDSGGSLIAINFSPTADANIKSVTTVTSNGSLTLSNQGIIPSGYSSPGFYSLYLNFTNGPSGSLHYQGFISGSVQTDFFGDIAGKAGTTFTSIGVNYTVLDLGGDPTAVNPGNAGSNFILVDNISIPEPTTTLTGLLALGFLGARRRR